MAHDPDKPISTPQYGRLLEEVLDRGAAYAYSILRNRDDANDVVQQAALRGLERISTYDLRRSFRSWWFVVLKNCCIDLLRSRRIPTVALDSVDPPATLESRADDWEELAAAMERIGLEHAEILRLRYFGDLTYRELSEALDIPGGTVMSRLHYARKALAAEMKGIES